MLDPDDAAPPDRLYKYRRALPPEDTEEWGWRRDTIVNSRLYLAPPTSLNDLFDCAPFWNCDASDEEIEEYIAKAAPRMAKNLSREQIAATISSVRERAKSPEFWTAKWTEIVDALGVYCLSTSACHPLMWAHYGGDHKGYCLEFNLGQMRSRRTSRICCQ